MVAQISEISGQAFDYVIIGGGTAGLTVGGRLVDDPTVSVAVLEAGEANLDDPLIEFAGQYGMTWQNEKYDWNFKTSAQEHAENRSIQWSAGKGLGGSSAINFHVWLKPHAVDVDAWEQLGNSGWNFEGYQKYSTRAEHYTAASDEQLKDFAHPAHSAAFRGVGGPIRTTQPWVHSTEGVFLDTLGNAGVNSARSAYGGENGGKWVMSNNLDRANNWTRSYAATGYYLPRKDKPNFKVLTNAQVTRILFRDEGSESLVATGVEFECDGQRYVVHAKKEVILSAGTLKSPIILENSGIGRGDVLDKIGVNPKMDLPSVGENLQEHIWTCVTFELKPDAKFSSFDSMWDPAFAEEQRRLRDLGRKNMHWMGCVSVAILPLSTVAPKSFEEFSQGIASYVAKSKGIETLPPGRAEQYDIQLATLENERVPDVELMCYPGFMAHATSSPESGKTYMSILVVNQHPFSRGSVHASPADPSKPVINPKLFSNPYDLDLMAHGVRYVQRLANVEPLKSSIVCEVQPGAAATDEQLREYVRKSVSTINHPVGTLSMLPRDKGGCVDAELRVYGTKNVRVCDNSIIPLHISAHTQSAAYMIGESLADMLKGASK